MNVKLTQPELEQLSAYYDGELSEAEARQVVAMIADQPSWQRAYAELAALDEAMDAYSAPAVPAGLAERIVAAAHGQASGRGLVIRMLKVALPAAAAAAIVLAVTLHERTAPRSGTNGQPRQLANYQPDTRAVDSLVVDNLNFFKSYSSVSTIASNEAVVDNETLEALDRLESQSGGI